MYYTNNFRLKKLKRIRGSSLLVAMIVLFAFTAIVLAGSHYLLGEQRISANQNDRQFAFQLAELALHKGEDTIQGLDRSLATNDATSIANLNLGDISNIFTVDCHISDTGAATTVDKAEAAAAVAANEKANWNKGGLCLSSEMDTANPKHDIARRRSVGGVSVLSPCGNSQEYTYEANAGACNASKVSAGTRVWSNPHYIVELISQNATRNSKTGRIYRITAQAWGRNKNTRVMLQSFFFVPDSSCNFRKC